MLSSEEQSHPKIYTLTSYDTPPISPPQVASPHIQPRKRSFLGIFLALCSAFLFSLSILTMKQLKAYPFYMYCFYRGLVSVTFATILLLCNKVNPLLSNARILLVSRGCIGVLAVGLTFVCVLNTPLVVSTTLMLLPPVISTLLGRIFYGEKCSLLKIIAFFLTLLGIVFVSDPRKIAGQELSPSDRKNIIGILCGVAGAICFSLLATLVKSVKNESVFIIQLYYSAVFTSINLMLSLGFNQILADQPIDYAFLFGNGIVVCGAELMIAKAFQIEDASILCAAMVTEVAFGMLWQWLFYKTPLSSFEVGGVATLVIAVLLLALWKYIDSLPESTKNRLKLKF